MFWLILAIVIFILYIIIAVFLFRMAICRNASIYFKKKHRKEETPITKAYREGAEWLLESPYEKHMTTSYDGLHLAGHFLPAYSSEENRAPEYILLCIHGYRSNSFKNTAYMEISITTIFAPIYGFRISAHMEKATVNIFVMV